MLKANFDMQVGNRRRTMPSSGNGILTDCPGWIGKDNETQCEDTRSGQPIYSPLRTEPNRTGKFTFVAHATNCARNHDRDSNDCSRGRENA
jgi:hypothetical protein